MVKRKIEINLEGIEAQLFEQLIKALTLNFQSLQMMGLPHDTQTIMFEFIQKLKKEMCLLILILFLIVPASKAQQAQKHFDKFSYGTIAAASVLSVADCEVNANRVASGNTKELNQFFRRADDSFNKGACYGVSAGWIGVSVLGQKLSPVKFKRAFDSVRIGFSAAKTLVVTVRF